MGEVMKIMLTSFKRSHALLHSVPLTLQQATADPPPETPKPSRPSLSQSLVGSLLFSPGSWCAQGSVCVLQESVSPVLCKFWWLCGGVNGDLLQEGLCHTQVCCTQSFCPCGRPLLTVPPQKTIKHNSVSVSVGSLGPGAHKVYLSPLSFSGRHGV